MTTREQLQAARKEAEQALSVVLCDPDVGGALRGLLVAHQAILLALLDESGLEGAISAAEHAAIMDDIYGANIGDR